MDIWWCIVALATTNVILKPYKELLVWLRMAKLVLKTLLVVNGGHSKNVYDLLSAYRIGFYKKLMLKKRSQKRFLIGWLNRLHILKSIHFSHKKVT